MAALKFEREAEVARQDPDHSGSDAVDLEGPTDQPGVTGIPALPEIVPQQHHRRAAGGVLRRGEGPPDPRPGAKHVEDVPGNPHRLDGFRFLSTGEAHVLRVIPQRHILE